MTLTPWVAEDHNPKPKGWRFEDGRVRDANGQFVSMQHAEIGKRIKVGEHVLLPLGIATASGVAANQLPQNQRSSKKQLKKIEDKKVNKQLSPVIKSDNPYFNHEYAQQMADLVMKMDDEEAYLFTHMVMAEVLDQDIEKNLRTLQRHLDEVVNKRLMAVKKALANQISKGANSEVEEFSKAVIEIEEVIKAGYKSGYTAGTYQFDESDFRRDPQTGRFQTKVIVNPAMRKPLGEKQADNLGIDVGVRGKTVDSLHPYRQLTTAQKAQYQQEYMQISNFLNAVGGSGDDHDSYLRIQDKGGQRYWKKLNGKPVVGQDWNPGAGDRVIAVEARPTGNKDLSLGGAAFSLTNSLGVPASRNTVRGINTFDQKSDNFANQWSRDDFDPAKSNERLYHRTATGSQFVMDLTPKGSKLNVAARFGRAVGDHGESAEKVFGPVTRRTAYRYRGTEKKPDASVLAAYDQAQARALDVSRLDPVEQRSLNRKFNAALTAERGRRAKASSTPIEAVQLPESERREVFNRVRGEFMSGINTERAADTGGSPLSPEDEVLVNHLMDRTRRPKKSLYGLQLDAGVTPPSEGFIVDKNGKVRTQAVGYGDDHYLPFNLKHLSHLRGGEYIRTRSVGGPTAEDIYTGLMAGAKKITVVSRSGTFTVDFESDFKGKRRYNDKALRMVRRYENLLDSVQSETVERNTQVSPEVKGFITEQVKSEGFDRTELRTEVQDRIKQYKEEMAMTTGDEGDFNLFFEEMSGDLPEERANALRSAMHNDWQAANEFKFKLNGWGYRDAMSALQEQFPYYFKTHWQPTREMDRFEPEKDKGYVEPGRNRPTGASAGLHGVKGVHEGQKFSASNANFQRSRGLKGTHGVGSDGKESTPEVNGGTLTPTDTDDKNEKAKDLKNKVADKKNQINALNAAVAIQQFVAEAADQDAKDKYDLLEKNADEAKEALRDPAEMRKFTNFLDSKDNRKKIPTKLLKDFDDSQGRIGRVKYTPELGLNTKAKPFLFDGKAYEEKAKPDLVNAEMKKLNRFKPISTDKSLSAMSDDELNTELDELVTLHELLEGETDEQRRKDILRNAEVRGTAISRLAKPDGLANYIQAVHKQRALNLNRTDRNDVGGGPVENKTVEHGTTPETPADPEQAERKKNLKKQVQQFRTAAKFYEERGQRELADKLDTAATSMEDLSMETTVSESRFNSLIEGIKNEGYPEQVMRALHEWETRKKPESS